jgi:hypothetical protein
VAAHRVACRVVLSSKKSVNIYVTLKAKAYQVLPPSDVSSVAARA